MGALFQREKRVQGPLLGNRERDYGPWEDGTTPEGKARLTGDVYGGDFKVIAAAMKKVDPDIFVGAPVVDYDDGSDWNGYRWWNKQLLPVVAGQVDLPQSTTAISAYGPMTAPKTTKNRIMNSFSATFIPLGKPRTGSTRW